MDGSFRKVLLAKIHGAVVTEANLHYEGSITIPDDLLEVSGLLPHEAVCVWNVTTGARFETYILKGAAHSKEFHVNGAAAHLAKAGDSLIIAAFAFLPHNDAVAHSPTAVFLNSDNSVKNIRDERPKTLVAV
jgi:aspartate 1-decarboxylase